MKSTDHKNKGSRQERDKSVFVFIDASNLWSVQKTKGWFLDLAKLRGYLKTTRGADKIRVYYYDAYPKQSTREHSVEGKQKFYVFLKKGLDFVVRKKPLKQISISTETGITTQEKGNMDVEIAMDVVNQVSNYDEAILFSGDSDFLALVRFVRSKNKKMYVYSSERNISSELRTGTDGYTDILDISDDIWSKKIKHRAQLKTPLDEEERPRM